MSKRSIPKGSARELAPEGTHVAVLVGVIDWGTQKATNPQFKDRHIVNTAWELVEEETADGKPVVTYKGYTYSSNSKSTLMKDLKAWLGVKDGDFDLEEALGKPALISIEHKQTETGTYDNIISVTALAKGQKAKKHREPLTSLFLDETFDQDVFDNLSQYNKDKIVTSDEYESIIAAKSKKPAGKTANKKR